MNTLKDHDRLLVTALLILLVAISAAAVPVAAQSTCGNAVTVVSGDTLYGIAQRCGTSVQAILRANPGITNRNLIFVGQVIAMPGAVSPTPTPMTNPGGATIYTVQPGDWLSRIAGRFNTTVAAIMQANPTIRNPNIIHVGTQLRIPTGAGAPAATPTPTPAPRQARLTIDPTRGPAGTQVQVGATGLPANAEVNIGVGRADSEYEVVKTARTTGDGVLVEEVTIPDRATAGERWVVVVETPDHAVKAVSAPFEVTG